MECSSTLNGGNAMSRTGLLAIAVLAIPLIAAADPPAPPKPQGLPQQFVGKWTVSFANGVIEICEVNANGTAYEREPNRASDGKAEVVDGAIVITFADDRVERWTAVDKQMVVEHWCPAQSYPAGRCVLDIANRMQ
jgi:hypothetical protein